MKKQLLLALIGVMFAMTLPAVTISNADQVDSISAVDSIRIKCFVDDFETGSSISRYAFLNSLGKKGMVKEMVIWDKQEVSNFLFLLAKLPFEEPAHLSSNEILFNLDCDKQGNITCTPQNSLGDNRGIVVLHKKNHNVFLWIAKDGIYCQKSHYKYTEDFLQLLGKLGVCLFVRRF